MGNTAKLISLWRLDRKSDQENATEEVHGTSAATIMDCSRVAAVRPE
jgi:hypothetical protein